MSLRKIYKGLDAPVPILFWDPSVAILALLMVGIGVVSKQIIFGLVGAFAVVSLSKKLGRGSKKGQGRHMIWRLGGGFIEPIFRKAGYEPLKNDFVD